MKDLLNKYFPIIKLIFAASGLISLINSKAYFQVYLFVFAVFVVALALRAWKIPCKFKNSKINNAVNNWNQTRTTKLNRSQFAAKMIFTTILTLCVLVANYDLILILINKPLNCFLCFLVICLGFYIIWNEILFLVIRGIAAKNTQPEAFVLSVSKHFIIPWAIIFVVYFIFFIGNLPGYVTADGMNQINQIISGEYSNHHPFWNTQLIRLFWIIGGAFDNINVSLSLYLTFQIICISCSFAYIIYTLYGSMVNRKVCWAICILFCIVPVYIIYSFELFKDILFTACVCFFVVSMFRLLKLKDSNKIANYSVLIISGIAMCVFRSNGLFMFIVSVLFFVLFNIKSIRQYIPLSAVLATIAIVGILLKFPALSVMNVKQPDLIEHLSIPGQQIARVVCECDDLAQDEQNLINDVISIDYVKQYYNPMFFDPIKDGIRIEDTQSKIAENKAAYLNLYIDLGLRYPDKYFLAWVDQTKNNWNAGYPCWVYQNLITWHPDQENIFSQVWGGNFIENICSAWRDFSVDNLPIIYSPGFYFWLVIIALFAAIIKKDRCLIICIIPVLVLWGSLMISSPTCLEFRYVYPLVCLWPFYFPLVFSSNHR